MNNIAYLKLQAKKLFKDYQTKKPHFDEVYDGYLYDYTPKYFDISSILFDYEDIIEECNWDEGNLSLMNIQHIFANILGFKKWANLTKASEDELELAKLLWSNQEKLPIADWDDQIAIDKLQLDTEFSHEVKLEVYKHRLAACEEYGGGSMFSHYVLSKAQVQALRSDKPKQEVKRVPDVQITSLPLSKADRKEFIEAANSVFETVIWRMEPQNPDAVRKLWNAESYIDNLLTENMLPISKSYALSLIDAFLVNDVLGLAVKADKMAASTAI